MPQIPSALPPNKRLSAQGRERLGFTQPGYTGLKCHRKCDHSDTTTNDNSKAFSRLASALCELRPHILGKSSDLFRPDCAGRRRNHAKRFIAPYHRQHRPNPETWFERDQTRHSVPSPIDRNSPVRLLLIDWLSAPGAHCLHRAGRPR